MKKQRAVLIQIPEPCRVPWQEMRQVDEYRHHCASCATVVTDFSDMSDLEIAAFIQANAGKKMCGKFNASQLNRPVALLPEQKRKAVWWKAALLLPLTFIHKIGNAQQQDTLTTSKKDSLVAVTQNSDSSFTVQQDTSGVENDSLSQLTVVDSFYQNIPDSMQPPLKCEITYDPNAEWIYRSIEWKITGNIASIPTYGFIVSDHELALAPQSLLGLHYLFRDTITQLKETITVTVSEFNKNIPRTDKSQPAPPPQQPAVPAQNENIVAVLTDNKRVPKRNN